MPTLYAALDDRVLVVDADRERARERLVGRDVECVAASPDAPDRVVAGTVDAGIQRSLDGGESWERVGPGVDDRITAVAVSPHDADVWWAGTEPSAVFRSTDDGETWHERPGLTELPSESRWSFPPRPDTHHVRWIEVGHDDPEHLLVAIEAGALVRSLDGGDTWVDHPDGARRDVHTVAIHPDAPQRVHVAAGDGYAVSDDGGETWRYPQDGLDHGYVWGVAVAPDDPDRVVVSAAAGARRAHSSTRPESYLYLRDGDGPWEQVRAGLPDPEGTVRADLTTADDGFYAVTNRGVFRSTDGARWRGLDVEWPEAYLDALPRGIAAV